MSRFAALRRALLKSLIQSIVLGVLSALAWQVTPVLGSFVLLVGSFMMVAGSYRKEWRLHWLTCLLPPIASGVAYWLQLTIMNLEPALVWVLPAAVVGGLIGLMRGAAHKTFIKGRAVFARKSIFFLLIWFISFAVTQLLVIARSEGLTQIGLAGGAFSTAVLAGAAIVLLMKYAGQSSQLARLPSPPPPGSGGGPPTIPLVLFICATLLTAWQATSLAQSDTPQVETKTIVQNIFDRQMVENLGLRVKRDRIKRNSDFNGWEREIDVDEYSYNSVAVVVGSAPSTLENLKFADEMWAMLAEAHGRRNPGYMVQADTISRQLDAYGDRAFYSQTYDGTQAIIIFHGPYRILIFVNVYSTWISDIRTADPEIAEKAAERCRALAPIVYDRFCTEIGEAPRQNSGGSPLDLFSGKTVKDTQEAAKRIIEAMTDPKYPHREEVGKFTKTGAAASVVLLLAAILSNIMNTLGVSMTQAVHLVDGAVASGGNVVGDWARPQSPPRTAPAPPDVDLDDGGSPPDVGLDDGETSPDVDLDDPASPPASRPDARLGPLLDPRTGQPLIDPNTGQPFVVNNGDYEGGELGQVWVGGQWVDRDDAERFARATAMNMIDPGTQQSLTVHDGTYEGGHVGQVWIGEWVDPDEAAHYLRTERLDQVRQRQGEIDAFWDDAQRRSAQWMDNRVNELQREAAAWRQAQSARDRGWADLNSLTDAAAKHGYTDLLQRADNAFNDDGSLDLDYLRRLKQTTRSRLARDLGTPDSDLQSYTGQWIVEGATDTFHDASRSTAMRLTLGVASGGSSEVYFQSVAAWDAMSRAAQEAHAQGRDLTFTDALGAGGGELARQNLPVNTLQAIQQIREGKDVGAGTLALSLLGDAAAVLDLHQTARNIKGSFGAMGQGKGALETLHFHDTSAVLPKSVSDWAGKRAAAAGQYFDEALDGTGISTRSIGDTYRRADAAVQRFGRDVSDGVDATLRRAGLRGDVDGLATGRLSPDEAVRYRDGRMLGSEARRHVDEVTNFGGRDVDELSDAFQAGRAQGLEKVNRFQDAVDELHRARANPDIDPSELRTLQQRVRNEALTIQADKHAMHQLNSLPKGADNVNPAIQQFNRELSDLYDVVDARTRTRIAQEFGVDPSDVQTLKVTNIEGEAGLVNPKAPDRPHYGLAAHTDGQGNILRRTGIDMDGAGRRVGDAADEAADVAAAGRRAAEEAQASPSPVRSDKASFDRDLTKRVLTRERMPRLDADGNVVRNASGEMVYEVKEVWRDVPADLTRKIYNEELWKVAKETDVVPPRAAGVDAHGRAPGDSLVDIHRVEDVDEFARRLDQASTDRLDAEAYGVGQPDLETATQGAYRGRDLIDVKGTAQTVKFKGHHWFNEADDLRRAAMGLDEGSPLRRQYLAAAEASTEEGMRQLTKQYNNMVITRTQSMLNAGNAPGAAIPADLAEKINVLRTVETGHLTPAQAEAVLGRMGTSTRGVADQMSRYIEGLQDLRAPRAPGGRPSIQIRGIHDEEAGRDQ